MNLYNSTEGIVIHDLSHTFLNVCNECVCVQTVSSRVHMNVHVCMQVYMQGISRYVQIHIDIRIRMDTCLHPKFRNFVWRAAASPPRSGGAVGESGFRADCGWAGLQEDRFC